MKPEFAPISVEVDAVGKVLVDSAFRVHNELGPGLLESVYEECLCHELRSRGVPFERQVALPIVYRELRLEGGLRLDLIVSAAVIVEIKSVEKTLPVHQAQLLTYLKLTGFRLGYLVNFNVPLIRDGIQRVVR